MHHKIPSLALGERELGQTHRLHQNSTRVESMDAPFADWWHEIIVFKPLVFEEAFEAVLAVREQHTVLLNICRMDPEHARRTIDFVIGAVTALDGQHLRIDEKVFLFAPSLVAIKTLQGSLIRDSSSKLSSADHQL